MRDKSRHLRVEPAAAPVRAGEAALAKRYREVRAATETLAAPLSAEDQMVQSMPDASPAKWHRAHTTWFFETFVLAPRGRTPFRAEYAYLFNSYYESFGERHCRPQRGLLSRPSAEEVGAYRRHVDEAMCELLADAGADPGLARLVELGLEHERQHQELLLTDILHAFAQNRLAPVYADFLPSPARDPGDMRFRDFEGGRIAIGHAGGGFAFDNEGPRHETVLRPYRLADRLVTNEEWRAFIEDGGYCEPRLWLSDGWQHVCREGWTAPLHWRRHDGQWFAMTLSGEREIEAAAPVAHVSFYEADAFARWRGKRLPSEAEWENAAAPLDAADGNYADDRFFRPLAAPPGGGLRQMFGDVWEWTQSAYAPYPGYRAPEGAIGEYNGKFMVNQMVLRGGSCASPRGHLRASYRNFFYPHQRWQFAGVRLAEDGDVRRRYHALRSVERPEDAFRGDVLDGLAQPQKRIPSKYLYDEEGSRLFDEICELPQYYPTRTEFALLRRLAGELGQHVAPDTALVEPGSGSCVKARILFDAIPALTGFVPVDISREHLDRTAAEFSAEYPHIAVESVVADFTRDFPLPGRFRDRPRLGFFPGSTIGNFTPDDAAAFLAAQRRTLGDGAKFLIGVDLEKGVDELISAYDDTPGVTAAFNRNLLVRINRELGGNFDPACFAHRAIWNATHSRMEMHLVSLRAQAVSVAGRAFRFAEGETIHTENSFKYTLDGFAALARRSGWSVEEVWKSEAPSFAVVLLA